MLVPPNILAALESRTFAPSNNPGTRLWHCWSCAVTCYQLQDASPLSAASDTYRDARHVCLSALPAPPLYQHSKVTNDQQMTTEVTSHNERSYVSTSRPHARLPRANKNLLAAELVHCSCSRSKIKPFHNQKPPSATRGSMFDVRTSILQADDMRTRILQLDDLRKHTLQLVSVTSLPVPLGCSRVTLRTKWNLTLQGLLFYTVLRKVTQILF